MGLCMSLPGFPLCHSRALHRPLLLGLAAWQVASEASVEEG